MNEWIKIQKEAETRQDKTRQERDRVHKTDKL